MPKISPLAIVLLCVALILFSLSVWAVSLSSRLESSPLKGLIFAVYAAILASVTLRNQHRPPFLRVLLISILIGLLLGEGVMRLINPPREDPDYRQAAPYIMFAGQPNGEIEADSIRLNALGYRDMPTLPKPPDEFRVMMLGGSAAFLGQPAIADALESDLQGRGYSGVRVYNWGVFSAVSGQELATILFRAVDYAPDLILVYNGANDLTEPYFFDPRPQYPFDYMATEGGRRLLEGQWGLFDLYAVLLRPSSLGYTLFQFEIEEQLTRRSQLAEQAGEGSAVWRAELAVGYGENLGKMCSLTRAFDFQLVAVLQPMIFFKDVLVGEEANWQGDADYQNHTRQSYDLARAELSRLAAELGSENCLFIDGSYLLQDERGERFIDPVHLTDEGNQIIGAKLGDLFVTEGVIR